MHSLIIPTGVLFSPPAAVATDLSGMPTFVDLIN